MVDDIYFDFEDAVDRKMQNALTRIRNIPIASLIWGPSTESNTAVAQTRMDLLDALNSRGHLARFSEELYKPGIDYSLVAQQLAQIEAHDIVFSIPESTGSIAEIHTFARIPWISGKIVAFLNQSMNDGYSNRSLIDLQSIGTCRLQFYDPNQLPNCIINSAVDMVERLQTAFYLTGRRF